MYSEVVFLLLAEVFPEKNKLETLQTTV